MRGLILGALIGAAAGLLLAPKRGKELQQDLKGKLKDKGVDVDELLSEENRRKVAGNLRDKVQDFKDRGQTYLVDPYGAENQANAPQSADTGQEIEVRVLDAPSEATPEPMTDAATEPTDEPVIEAASFPSVPDDPHRTKKLEDE